MKKLAFLLALFAFNAQAATCTSTNVSVTTSSTEVLAANGGYDTVLIQNTDASNTVYVAVGKTATTSDAKLVAGVGISFDKLTSFSQAFNAIGSGTSNVAVITCKQ